jgi:hypothetical protein
MVQAVPRSGDRCEATFNVGAEEDFFALAALLPCLVAGWAGSGYGHIS